MAFKDIREYIARLEELGEIQRIKKEVDWNMEVGGIIRRSYDLKAPAPFFENLKGYPEGYRIFGAPLGKSNKPNLFHVRAAISLGMKPDSSIIDIIEQYIVKKKDRIKPILVSDGPCKENIHLGEEVDLLKFPAPLIHGGDGGRYIGTWHTVITKDPDSGWVNWGMYRLMIHDSKTIGGTMPPPQHIGMHYQKYEARNKPMEFAVALGTEPVISMISASPVPVGVNEADIIGSIRGEPLQVIKCETVDLQVPASSEIVIEGEVLPNERKEEGPFGEYTGFRAGERAPRPVYRVKAITHRNDPILPVSCMGVPIDESAANMEITWSGELLDVLRTQGFPVKMAYFPAYGVNHMVVVSTEVPYARYPQKLAHAVWASKPGTWAFYLIIVEDDIDATNIGEVIWTISTKCHPDRGIFKVPNAPGHMLVPFLTSYEKEQGLGAYTLFDCTWPKEWPKEAIPEKASFDAMWPKEVQEMILKNWREYGYKE